jgi:uncharacterized protein (TIGR03066 family)
MPTATRASFLTIGLGVALVTGCDKSATTPAAGTPTTTAAPGKPADSDAGKQLVGVWESVNEPKKGEADDRATVEFKADGGLTITMGSPPMTFEMTGTWKMAKDEGKTVTIDTDLTLKGFPDGKSDKKVFKITFDDADTMTMTPADKPDPKKFNRKK